MKLEEKSRLHRQTLEFGVADARIHLYIVEQFDARHGNARLHRDDPRVYRRREIGELAHGGGNGLGHAIQAELDLGDDAERAFGADE